MNRFFSKLDLRDIKIDPTGSRFPPDGETVEDTEVEERYEEAAPVEASAPVEVVEETTTLTEEYDDEELEVVQEAPARAEHSEVLKVPPNHGQAPSPEPSRASFARQAGPKCRR